MDDKFSRTELLFGKGKMDKLSHSRVAVFGIGGVGGYAVEALVRGGIGEIDIVDSDTVSKSNINRQIYALESTVGRYKVDVAKERILDINPHCTVHAHNLFFTMDTADKFEFGKFDYIVDAIDTVSGKIALAELAKKSGVPIISSMGAGGKLDTTAFEVADIYSTSVCPLARVMRRELKKRGIEKLKVVYSKEQSLSPSEFADSGKPIPSSCSFVPPVVGLIIAGEVIKDLTENI